MFDLQLYLTSKKFIKFGTVNCLYRLKIFFMKKYLFYLFVACALFIAACTTNAITGRKQLSLVSESALTARSSYQYKSFLSQNNVVSSSRTSKDAEMVKRVGNRIADAITKYYT